jgi:hypothetical protein
MTEPTRQEDQTPASIVSQVQGIIHDNLHEQMNKLRFLRELTMNLCENPDMNALRGEESPIHGLFPILDEVTKAYNETMAKIEKVSRDG